MKGFKLYTKYIMRYIVIIAIILVSSLPILRGAYDLAEKNILNQTTARVENGMEVLTNELQRMYSLTSIMQDNKYFKELQNVKGELPREKYVYMTYLADQVMSTNVLMDFTPLNFLIFRDNDVFISNKTVSAEFGSYYDDFLNINGYTAQEFHALAFDNSKSSQFFRVDSMHLPVADQPIVIDDPVICIMHPYSSSRIINERAAMVFVIEYDTLVELFSQGGQLPDERVEILESRNNQLFSLGSLQSEEAFIVNNAQYQAFVHEDETFPVQVNYGVPKSAIDEEVVDIMRIFYIYLFIGVIVIIALSLVFSYTQYVPVQNLLNIFTPEGGEGKSYPSRNEFGFISSSVENIIHANDEYRLRLDLLDNQMKVSMLENVLLRGVHTEEEKEDFVRVFGMEISFFCVALMRIDVTDRTVYTQAVLETSEFIQEESPHQLFSISSGATDTLFLVLLEPEDESNVQDIKVLFENAVNQMEERLDATINVGISGIGEDVTTVHSCYNQAKNAIVAYDSEGTNSVIVYNSALLYEQNNIVNIEFFQKLNTLIQAGEKEGLKELFQRLLRRWVKVGPQASKQRQQWFYSISQIMYSTYLDLSIESSDIVQPVYSEELPLEALVAVLQEFSFEICDVITQARETRNNQLKDNVMEFIQENYADSTLTTAMISQVLGVSEKYIYKIVRDYTGKTFAQHVEFLRVEKAKELLSTTQLTNVEIAEKIGYHAMPTFYRVFRRNVGVAPGEYREMQSL